MPILQLVASDKILLIYENKSLNLFIVVGKEPKKTDIIEVDTSNLGGE